MDSSLDDVEQLKNDYEKYAEAVVKALAEYTGTKYEPVSGDFYIVEKGDSLWSISKKFGVTVAELKKLNNLTSNLLSVGQLLKIPTKETSEDYYVVKSGDTLYSIAKKYNTTVDEIKKLNNLTSNTLTINQQLKIPSNEQTKDEIIYTVQKGDNLYSISKRYGLTQQELMDYNNLTSNLLSIGQQLKIPTSNSQITYTVKSGDTLYSIAKKYNTTVNEIKAKNNLTSNTLSLGQVLKI